MAFEFISIKRIVRKSEYEHHGYEVDLKYEGKKICCKIYTEAFFNNLGSILIICDRFNYQSLNGDFRFKIEMPTKFKNLEKLLEKEILQKTN